MNKTELVNAIAEKAGLTKVDAKNALDATLTAIADALKNDDKVALVGFGTFSVTEKAARTGINPRTKEKIEIPARKVVKFKAGADLVKKIHLATNLSPAATARTVQAVAAGTLSLSPFCRPRQPF